MPAQIDFWWRMLAVGCALIEHLREKKDGKVSQAPQQEVSRAGWEKRGLASGLATSSRHIDSFSWLRISPKAPSIGRRRLAGAHEASDCRGRRAFAVGH